MALQFLRSVFAAAIEWLRGNSKVDLADLLEATLEAYVNDPTIDEEAANDGNPAGIPTLIRWCRCSGRPCIVADSGTESEETSNASSSYATGKSRGIAVGNQSEGEGHIGSNHSTEQGTANRSSSHGLHPGV